MDKYFFYWTHKLKRKWNINSNIQFWLIMLVFSLTGMGSLAARSYIFQWLGITSETSLWFKIPLYIIIVFPIYQILFLLIGTLLGQFQFAWAFEKKMLSRFRCRK